jgi:hypothetical protein
VNGLADKEGEIGHNEKISGREGNYSHFIIFVYHEELVCQTVHKNSSTSRATYGAKSKKKNCFTNEPELC